MSFTFGAAPAATPGARPPLLSGALFGGSTQSSTPFGQQASTAPTAPSLFGSAAPAASAPAASGGLFGAAPTSTAPTSTPFSFGAPAATAAPQTGGLFGAAQPATSAAPSLFGAASQPAPSGGLFGSTAPAAQPTAGGLFGQSQQAQPQAAGGMFGQSAQAQAQPGAAAPGLGQSGSLFGQSQSAATASLFGPKPTTNNNNNSLFGSQQNTQQLQPFGVSTSAPTQPQQPVPKLGDPYPPPPPGEPSIESRLEAIKDGWDTSNPKCRFQTYFYNAVPAGQQTGGYAKPPGAEEKAWAKAVRENPEPEKLVPALALGFPALQKRIDAQNAASLSHQAILSQISTHLSSISDTHSLQHSVRALRAQITAQALSARLSALVAKVSKVSPTRGVSLRIEEDELRKRLEAMRREVELGEERGRELWSGVGAVKAKREAGMAQGGGGVEWAVADEEGLRKILDILGGQQTGLDHLTKTLKEAEEDVGVMKEAFGL